MKVVQSMAVGDIVRQGDVFLQRIGEANEPINPVEIVEDGILARGEVTGHIHEVADMTMLSEEDQKFLEEISMRICRPLVFKDPETVTVRTTSNSGIPLVQYRIAKVHAPEPFILAHYDSATRIIPSDEEALARDLHHAVLLPAGLYMAIQQGEHDEEKEMRRVVD